MPKSVLVADDSVTIRKVVGLVFATEDFTITAVDNGLDAISKAREIVPDLVLADVAMPGKCFESCSAGINVTPSVANAYYLVVPHNTFAEGSYGTDLAPDNVRSERPRPSAATARCAPFQMITACR